MLDQGVEERLTFKMASALQGVDTAGQVKGEKK